MTQQDKDLDDLIRAASARDTDEAATYRAVLEQITQPERQPLFRLPGFGPNMAAAGFAAMMCIAGLAGYTLPDLTLGDPDDDLFLIALGDTGGTARAFFSGLEQSE